MAEPSDNKVRAISPEVGEVIKVSEKTAGSFCSLIVCWALTPVIGLRLVPTITDDEGKRVNESAENDIAVLGCVAVSKYWSP